MKRITMFLILFFFFLGHPVVAGICLINVWVKDSFDDPVSGATVGISECIGDNECMTFSNGVCSFYVTTYDDPLLTLRFTITVTHDYFPISPSSQVVEIPGGTHAAVYDLSFEAECGKLTGTLTFDTDMPLTTAPISADDPISGKSRISFSDHTGAYFIKLRPGTYDVSIGTGLVADKLRARRGNYIIPDEEVEIFKNLVVEQDFVIPDTCIRGTITDPYDAPISEIPVLLSSIDEPSRFIVPEKTSAEGFYSFDFIPFGEYKLDLFLPDAILSFPPVTLTPANRDIVINRKITEIGEIKGQVHIDSLEDLIITATSKDLQYEYPAEIKRTGAYSIKGIRLGDYSVTATKVGHGYDVFPSQEASLTKGSPVATLNFYAFPGVMNITCPFPETSIQIWSVVPDGLKSHSDHTVDSPTTLTLKYLPYGSYKIKPINTTYTLLEEEVTISEEHNPVYVALTQGNSSLSVITKDSNHNPLSETTLHVVEPLSGLDRIEPTDKGEYIFSGLTEGFYRITATKESYSIENKNIYLKSNEHHEVEVILSPNPLSVSGNVFESASNEPLKNATVTLINESTHSSFQTTTTATGEFNFSDIAPGTYAIFTQQQGYAQKCQQGVELLTPGLHLSIPLSMETGCISGHVYKEDGVTPFSQVTVRASSESAESCSSATSNESGFYSIEVLSPANDYVVTATVAAGESYEVFSLSPVVVELEEITTVDIIMVLVEE